MDSGASSLKSMLGWISQLCWYLSLQYSVKGPRNVAAQSGLDFLTRKHHAGIP